MSIAKSLILAGFMSVSAAIYPQDLDAQETFTSAEFLKWKLSDQKGYFRTNIGMASLIAAQNDRAHAKCIEDWYLGSEREAADYILASMRRYPEHHPRAIIMAALQKVCGPFKYS